MREMKQFHNTGGCGMFFEGTLNWVGLRKLYLAGIMIKSQCGER